MIPRLCCLAAQAAPARPCVGRARPRRTAYAITAAGHPAADCRAGIAAAAAKHPKKKAWGARIAKKRRTLPPRARPPQGGAGAAPPPFAPPRAKRQARPGAAAPPPTARRRGATAAPVKGGAGEGVADARPTRGRRSTAAGRAHRSRNPPTDRRPPWAGGGRERGAGADREGEARPHEGSGHGGAPGDRAATKAGRPTPATAGHAPKAGNRRPRARTA